MCGGGGEDRLGFAESAIDKGEAFEESRQCARADGNMPPYLHVPASYLAGYDFESLFGGGVFHPQQVLRQEFAEAAMDSADACGARSRSAA